MILDGDDVENLITLGVLGLKAGIRLEKITLNKVTYSNICQSLGSKIWRDSFGIMQFQIAIRNGEEYTMKILEDET